MIPPDIPQPIAQAIVNRCGIISVRKLAAGLSGATVAHCRASDGHEYALKRWPASFSRSRIESIHRVIIHSWEEGCKIVALPIVFQLPANQTRINTSGTVLAVNGEHWELCQWRPGEPLPYSADLNSIRRGAEAISQFHVSAASLGSIQQPPPIIKERLRTLASRRQHIPIPSQLIDRPDLPSVVVAALRDASQLMRLNWNEACDQIHRSLTKHADCSTATQYVLRDVHAEHLLFSAEKPTGLIDFDAVRIDTPAADLARWAGSFLPGQHSVEEVWEAVLAGYCGNTDQSGHADMNSLIKLATDLCFAGTWLSLANWLVWLLLERRNFAAPPEVLAERIHNLIRAATAHD